jgi:hypothetical protein
LSRNLDSERAQHSEDPPNTGIEDLTVAVRVWTPRTAPADLAAANSADCPGRNIVRAPTRAVKRRYPAEALIFDTETETDPAQRLRFLVWRLYSDPHGSAPGYFCVEEGIAYPDDLPERDAAAFELLTRHASTRAADVADGFGGTGSDAVLVRPVSWWLHDRLLTYGFKHRNRCAVVGFNLPFDLGRLASHWSPARRYYRGGFSLGLWGRFDERERWQDARYTPRLLLKAIDPRRTLFGWGSLKQGDQDEKGAAAKFIDLRTLTFALTDRSYTLEGACAAFGDPFEKAEVEYDKLTPELIDYALDDVRHTSMLYQHTLAELAQHEGVALQPHRLYSPATVGACYLEAMGLERPLEKFTHLSDEQLGWDGRRYDEPQAAKADEDAGISEEVLGFAMSAFYGGRAEARIVRTPVPIVHVDFTSMYPAVNALLSTWNILRAASARTIDATGEVRELLAEPDLLARCLTRELWAQVGVTLVEAEPDRDLLPTRASYQPGKPDLGIALNPLSYDGTLWYAFPDVIAATVLGGKAPTITRAIRIVGNGVQDGLRAVALRGGETLDPAGAQDPFLVMIEERARVKADPSLTEEERERLQLFLKITANATAYGSLARFDRRDLAEDTSVTIYGPDARPRAGSTRTPEDPGPYCFPPVACSITAGARLMLALLERLVSDAGGSYAFCDTDSMAIVSTQKGGPVSCQDAERDTIRALPWSAVREILARFDALNPYDPELLQPWKVEHDSLDRQLYCYTISAKRYALYRLRADGTPDLITTEDSDDIPTDDADSPSDSLTDWSEHGLGLYLDPLSATPESPSRDTQGRRVWTRQAWEWILANAHGTPCEQPAWCSRPALTRFTLSSPTLGAWFTGYNQSRPREEHIRPGSFGLIAHPDPTFYTDGAPTALPAAPYESNPERWDSLAWYDRSTGKLLTVTTAQQRDDPERFADALTSGAIVIDTLGAVLSRYGRRPEHKSLAPDGQPATGRTHGLLRRRPVASSPVHTLLTGKEGNRITERLTGQTSDIGEYRNDYGKRVDRWDVILQVLKDIGPGRIIGHGIPHSTVHDTLRGARPRKHYAAYLGVASAHATASLQRWGSKVPTDPSSQLTAYLREHDRRTNGLRLCEHCGRPLTASARSDARYDTAACRKAAVRRRRAS